MNLRQYVSAWWRLSRAPFLSVGLLPLILGFVLAWRKGYHGPPGLYLFSLVTVILIMWMAYYLGDWNDLAGDRSNRQFNRFSGGSRVLVDGLLPVRVSFYLGYGCLLAAILAGLFLHLRYGTGPWTLLLGGIGILSGFFYSNGPFRWASRGVGEVFVAFCYGWLPIATGFYLFAGFFDPEILPLSIPVGLSVFNLILINEFPDEEADRTIRKMNLVVRFGKRRMGDVYLGLSILLGLFFIKVLLLFSRPFPWIFVLSGIPLLLIVWNMVWVWRENYEDSMALEVLCRNSLLVNLTMTMILTIQQTLVVTGGRTIKG
jgi:1,4-dihydroxy-2-naphthoate polyprenyltransferase